MDFSAMFQTWIGAVTNPNEEWYETNKQNPNATVGTAVIWIVIATVITGVIGLIFLTLGLGAAAATAQLEQQLQGLPPDVQEQTLELVTFLTGTAGGVIGVIISVIITPIFFLIGTGITHLIAGLFGGQGSFGRFAYLSAAFTAPLNVLSSVLSIIPCVGLFVTIYSLVLSFFAVRANYGLGTGRAIAVILTPLVLLFLFLIILVIIVVAIVVAAEGAWLFAPSV